MKEKRRESTIVRHDIVHRANEEVKALLGNKIYWSVSRDMIYDMIHERTGLSKRRIQYIINHTRRSDE